MGVLTTLNPVIYGAFGASFLIGGLYFLKIWKFTRHVFPLFVALAFIVLGASYFLLGTGYVNSEYTATGYIMRLTAFSLIAVGMLVTNLKKK